MVKYILPDNKLKMVCGEVWGVQDASPAVMMEAMMHPFSDKNKTFFRTLILHENQGDASWERHFNHNLWC